MVKSLPGSERILILGGTKEAAALAQSLVDSGAEVISSLAGRTKEPVPVAGSTRTGGFGGTEKMATWIIENHITKVIDATHPFARQISRNAVRACAIANVELEQQQRTPWPQRDGDLWTEVDTLDDAANAIPPGARVLLALGSQYLNTFSQRDDVHFVVRMVDQPQSAPDLASHDLLLGRPHSNWQDEAQLLKAHKVSHIVCRNSGGTGAYAKIIAARELAIPVILIKMPV